MEIIAAAWVPAPQADPAQDRAAQQAAVQQLEHYVRHYAESMSRVAQAESSFSFGLERQVLVGKIDLLRHYNGGYELVDFKTGRSAPAALEEVDVQLDLYALGAELSLKVPVLQQGVHFLGDDKVYVQEWSSARAVSAKERLGTLVEQIIQQEFPPKPGYCPRRDEFRAICPYAGGVQ